MIHQDATTPGRVPPDVVFHDSQRVHHPGDGAAGWAFDLEHDHLQWSSSPRAILGARWPVDWASLDDDQLGRRLLEPVLVALRSITDTQLDTQQRIRCADGERTIHLAVEPDPDRPGRWTGFARDVTETVSDNLAMQELLVRYQMLTDLSPDAIVVHQDGKVVYANKTAARFAQVEDPAMLIGMKIADFTPIEDDAAVTIANMAAMNKIGDYVHHGDIVIDAMNGSRYIMDCISMFTTWNASPAFQIVMRDITQIRAAEAQLQWQANHDPLTGLCNRTPFVQRVQTAVSAPHTQHVAVFHLALDGFSLVNDSLGYEAGNQALIILAGRLCELLRDDDLVARLASDEMVILCERVDPDAVLTIANRIADCVRQPLPLGEGRTITVTCSVGAACCAAGQHDADWLMQGSDMAVRTAKRGGRNRVRVFDELMRSHSNHQLKTANDLRAALDCQQIMAYYQPIIDFSSNEMVGVEALVRWQHPERGLVSPGEFIPVAESTGIIVDLGRFMLKQACDQAAAWRQSGIMQDLYVSVNLSVKQLEDQWLIEWVKECLSSSGLPPEALVLEITESLLIVDPDRSIQILGRIREMGVRLAIDDFGTGYSSLAYLKRLPFDIVKLDKAFVDDIASSHTDQAIAAGIVQMCRALHLPVCAEGVEQELQALALRSIGCSTYQGYLALPPVPPEQLLTWHDGRG